MSGFSARERLATVAFFTVCAIVFTAWKSPGEAMAKPASMMSTPKRSSWRATSVFSCKFMLQPGDCSPSRSVVSNTLTCLMISLLFVWLMQRPHSRIPAGISRNPPQKAVLFGDPGETKKPFILQRRKTFAVPLCLR